MQSATIPSSSPVVSPVKYKPAPKRIKLEPKKLFIEPQVPSPTSNYCTPEEGPDVSSEPEAESSEPISRQMTPEISDFAHKPMSRQSLIRSTNLVNSSQLELEDIVITHKTASRSTSTLTAIESDDEAIESDDDILAAETQYPASQASSSKKLDTAATQLTEESEPSGQPANTQDIMRTYLTESVLESLPQPSLLER